MKIAFVNTNMVTCGGIITNYEYVKEIRQRGIEANLYANDGNTELEKSYGIKQVPIENLDGCGDEDVIIANRWEQCSELEKYKGRKIQFVQGNDRYYYESVNHCDLQKMIDTRNNPNWELIGVSEYVLKDWGRGTVISNGINSRFFQKLDVERDIDALVEGTNENLKNIDYAIQKAKEDGHKRIVWMGCETKPVEGVECITNPPQEEIPKIYQRAKHFYKYSHSEGFSLPVVEAKASGCILHLGDMGHNFPEDFDPKQYTWSKACDKLLEYLNGTNTKS